MESLNLLDTHQFIFTRGKSTDSVNKICFEGKKTCLTICTELSEAFYCINHQKKLSGMVFEEYLKNSLSHIESSRKGFP